MTIDKSIIFIFFCIIFNVLPSFASTDSLKVDSDLDLILDSIDLDDDNDGLLDVEEQECVYISQMEGSEGILEDQTFRAIKSYGADQLIYEMTDDYTDKYVNDGIDENGFDGTFDFTRDPFSHKFTFPEGKNATGILKFGPNILGNKNFYYNSSLGNISHTLEFPEGVKAIMHDPLNQTSIDHNAEVISGTSNILIDGSRGLSLGSLTWHIKFIFENVDSFYIVEQHSIYYDFYGFGFDFSEVSFCRDLDADEDGIPNHLDLDSDNDGCFDVVEAGITASHKNGQVVGEVGENGYLNLLEELDETPTTQYLKPLLFPVVSSDMRACEDTDGDRISDIMDIDDDNDGILDKYEQSCNTATFDEMLVTGDTLRNTINYAGMKMQFEAAFLEPIWSIKTESAGLGTYEVEVREEEYMLELNFDAEDYIYNQQITLGPGVSAEGDNQTIDLEEETVQVKIPRGLTATLRDPSGTISNFADFSRLSGIVNLKQREKSKTRAWFIELDPIDLLGDIAFSITYSEREEIKSTQYMGFHASFCQSIDTDFDGIPNHLDTDSDNDNCPDKSEVFGGQKKQETFIGPYGRNGFANMLDAGVFPNNLEYSTVAHLDACDDLDSDGVFDGNDIDDDNDGIIDAIECPNDKVGVNLLDNGLFEASALSGSKWTFDTGITLKNDSSDNPGSGKYVQFSVNDAVLSQQINDLEIGAIYQLSFYVKNNGESTSFLEVGIDSIYQIAEQTEKIDGWHLHNYFVVATQQDAVLRFKSSPDIEGVGALFLDQVVFQKIEKASCVDTDGDTVPDFQDLDSDGDGLPDNLESRLIFDYKEPSKKDLNRNGLDDNYDRQRNFYPVDSDLDGLPDYLDTDSDNKEGGDTDENNLTLSGKDLDRNGLDDALQGSNGYDKPNGSLNNLSSLPNDNAILIRNFREVDNIYSDCPPASERSIVPGELTHVSTISGAGIQNEGFAIGKPDGKGATIYSNNPIELVFSKALQKGDYLLVHFLKRSYSETKIKVSLNEKDHYFTLYENQEKIRLEVAETISEIVVEVLSPGQTVDIDGAEGVNLVCSFDTDNDGISNDIDIDDDNDGIEDRFEKGTRMTSSGCSKDFLWASNWVDHRANINDEIVVAFIPAKQIIDLDLLPWKGASFRDGAWTPRLDYPFDNNGGQFCFSQSVIDPIVVFGGSGGTSDQCWKFDDAVKEFWDLGNASFDGELICSKNGGSFAVQLKGEVTCISFLSSESFETTFNVGLPCIAGTLQSEVVVEKGADIDTDQDGIFDRLDLDSDGDGIPDIVEAQGTDWYQKPLQVDVNKNGLDDQFDSAAKGKSIEPVDTDSDGLPDYIDIDSDSQGQNDESESGLSLTGIDADKDGLDDGVDNTSDYTNPSGVIGDISDLKNSNATFELDFRENDPTACSGAGETRVVSEVLNTSRVSGNVKNINDGRSIDNTTIKFSSASDQALFQLVNTLNVYDSLYIIASTPSKLASIKVDFVSAQGKTLFTKIIRIGNQGLKRKGIFVPVACSAFRVSAADNNSIFEVDGLIGARMDCGIDHDGDGIEYDLDLDKDNDGIVDENEAFCGKVDDFTILPKYTSIRYSWGVVSPSRAIQKGKIGNCEITITLESVGLGSYGVNNNYNGKVHTIRFSQPVYRPRLFFSTLGNSGHRVFWEFNQPVRKMNGSIQQVNATTISGQEHYGRISIDNDAVTSISWTTQKGSPNSVETTNVYVELDRLGCNSVQDCDFDDDGINDFLDIDSDNDGVLDMVEAELEPGLNGFAPFIDNDLDGLHDAFDQSFGEKPLYLIDTDRDRSPDALDTDSDNDNCWDAIEGNTGAEPNNRGVIPGPYGRNGLAKAQEEDDSYFTDITFIFNPRYKDTRDNSCPIRLSGNTFMDCNKNGLFEEGEEAIESVKVQLLDTNFAILESTLSDKNGYYSLYIDAAKDYHIRMILPNGYQTLQPTKKVLLNSDLANKLNANSVSDTFSVSSSVASYVLSGGFMDSVEPELFGFQPIEAGCTAFELPAIYGEDNYAKLVDVSFDSLVFGSVNAPDSIAYIWKADDGCLNYREDTLMAVPTSNMDLDITFGELSVCEKEGNVIVGSIDGGTAPYTIKWDIVGENARVENSSSIETYVTFTDTIPKKIRLTITESNGCRASIEKVIKASYKIPNISLSGNSIYCFGDTLILNASGGESYTWFGPNEHSSEGSTLFIPEVNLNMGGEYGVEISNGTYCKDTLSKVITVARSATPKITAASTMCLGQTVEFTSDGAEDSYYDWSFPFNVDTTKTVSVVVDSFGVGSHQVVVEMVPQNGCSGFGTLVFEVNEPALKKLPQDTTLCADASYVFDFENIKSGFWSTEGSVRQNTTIDLRGVEETSKVFYAMEDVAGCQFSDSINIEVKRASSLSLDIETSCDGEEVDIKSGAKDGESLKWFMNDSLIGTDVNIIIKNIQAEEPFEVKTIVEENGCTDSILTLIETVNQIQSVVEVQPSSCGAEDGTIDVALSEGIEFAWKDGDEALNRTNLEAGIYVLELTKGACSATENILIEESCATKVEGYIYFGCLPFEEMESIIAPDVTVLLKKENGTLVKSAPLKNGYFTLPFTYESGTYYLELETETLPGGIVIEESAQNLEFDGLVSSLFELEDGESFPVSINFTDTETPVLENELEDGEILCGDFGSIPEPLISDNFMDGITITKSIDTVRFNGVDDSIRVTWDVRDVCGQGFTKTVSYNLKATFSLRITPSKLGLCGDDTLKLEVRTNGKNLRYTWSSIDGSFSDTSGTETYFSSSNDTLDKVFLVAQDELGCANIIEQEVNIFPELDHVAQIEGETLVCEGTQIIWRAKGEGQAIWYTPNGQVLQRDDIDIRVDSSTIGTYRLVLINEKGCRGEVEKALSFGRPTFNIVAYDTLCYGEESSYKLDGVDNMETVKWYVGDSLLSEEAEWTLISSHLDTGFHQIKSIINENTTCPDTLWKDLQVLNSNPFKLPGDTVFCSVDDLEFNVAGVTDLVWTLDSTKNLTNEQRGINKILDLNIKGETLTGCPFERSIEVVIPDFRDVAISMDQNCNDKELFFNTVDSLDMYEWKIDNESVSTQQAFKYEPEQEEVEVELEVEHNDCPYVVKQTFYPRFIALGEVEILHQTCTSLGNISIEQQEGYSIQWSDTDVQSFDRINIEAGEYYYTLIHDDCILEDTVTVLYNCEESGSSTDTVIVVGLTRTEQLCLDDGFELIDKPSQKVVKRNACFDVTAIEKSDETIRFVRCVGTLCDTVAVEVTVKLPTKEIQELPFVPNEVIELCYDTTDFGNAVYLEEICENDLDFEVTGKNCLQLEPMSEPIELCMRQCHTVYDFCDTFMYNLVPITDSIIELNPDDIFLKKDGSSVFDLVENDSLGNQLDSFYLVGEPPFVTYFKNGKIKVSDSVCFGEKEFSYVVIKNGQKYLGKVTLNYPCSIEFLSGISPNNDGINDAFRIKGLEAIPENTLQVFNRYGSQVYGMENYSNASPWKGTFNGKRLPTGTYFYVFKPKGGVAKSGYLQILE